MSMGQFIKIILETFRPFLSKTASGIVIASAIAAGVDFQKPLAQGIMLGSSLFIIATAATTTLKMRGHRIAAHTLMSIIKDRIELSPYEVKYVESESELKDLWEFDEECYGAENIPYERLFEWWQAYEKGIHLLKQNGKIIGAFGLWPLTKSAFDALVDGRMHEHDVGPKDIRPAHIKAGIRHWYIAGIVIRIHFRRTRALNYLLSVAIGRWLNEGNLASTIRLCALAYSPEGEALLRRLHFAKVRNADDTLDRHPSYVYHAKDLKSIFGLTEQICHPIK